MWVYRFFLCKGKMRHRNLDYSQIRVEFLTRSTAIVMNAMKFGYTYIIDKYILSNPGTRGEQIMCIKYPKGIGYEGREVYMCSRDVV